MRTICGRSRESLPIVLNTRSCNLFTTPSRSSPKDAMLESQQDNIAFSMNGRPTGSTLLRSGRVEWTLSFHLSFLGSHSTLDISSRERTVGVRTVVAPNCDE